MTLQKRLHNLQRGQGFIEYGMMIAVIAIVAIPTVSFLANPQDFQQGAIYQNVMAPVFCRVQGKDANCNSHGGYEYNYPTANNPDSGKTIVKSGEGGDGNGDSVSITGIQVLNAATGDYVQMLNEGGEVAPGTYHFRAVTSGGATDVSFALAQGGTPVANQDDNADPFDLDAGGSGITLTDGQSYVLTARPSKDMEPGANFEVDFSVTLTADPDHANNLFVGGIRLVDANLDTEVMYVNTAVPFEAGTWDLVAEMTLSSGTPAYVRMELTGPVTQTNDVTGNTLAFFGFSAGDYTGGALTAGDYTLTATPYDATDNAGMPYTIDFTVTAPATPISITGMTLINATTDVPVGALTNGNTIDTTSDELTVSAAVDGPVQSIAFTLVGPSGTLVDNFVENSDPYSLFGDSSGNYSGSVLAVGSYTLTATPYYNNSGNGLSGDPVSVSFTVENANVPEVTTVKLIDIDTMAEITTLNDGDFLPDATNVNFYIEANEYTESMKIVITGPGINNTQGENAVPYGAFGDNSGHDFEVGTFTLTATPYSRDGRNDADAGTVFTMTFRVEELQYAGETFEAESGNINGSFTTGTEGGTTYVHAPENVGDNYSNANSNHYVEFTFTVPKAGSYVLYATVKGLDGTSDSFWVKSGSQSTAFHHGSGSYSEQTVGTFTLDAGANVIRFALREDGSRLDKVRLEAVD
jgi:hypothetical protein